MRTLITLLLILGSLSVSAQGFVLEWDDEITVNANPDLDRTRPRIALLGDNTPVVLWGNSNTSKVYVSTMVADTFGTAVWVNSGGPDAYVRNWTGPSIFAIGDTVLVTFDQIDAEIGAVWFQRSNDRGATWSDTVRVDVSTGNGMARLGNVATKNGRDLLCAYVLADSNDSNGEAQLARSTDGGATWLPSVVASAASVGLVCDCCPVGITVEGDRSAVLFRNNDINIRDIRAAISEDNGQTISVVHDLDTLDWDISSCPSTGPDGVLHGDSISYVWMYGGAPPAKVYIGTAHVVTGETRIIAINDSSLAAQNYPRIAGKGDTLAAVWRENLDGSPEIQLRWSIAGMAKLQAPVRVNVDPTSLQDLPDVAYANGEIHVVWQDENLERVAYRKGRIVPAVGVDAAEVRSSFKCFPNPTSGSIQIQNEAAGTFHLMDATGKLLTSVELIPGTHRFDLGTYPVGFYGCMWIGAEGERQFTKLLLR